MNKVTIIMPNRNKLGSLWKNERGEHFIHAGYSEDKYVYICLDDGQKWDNPFTDINDTQDLTLVAYEAKIEITPI